MSNDSSTGGFLQPIATGFDDLQDDALDDFFHDLIVGITGICPTLVRPRWTPEPANMPKFGTNWIAQGVEQKPEDDMVNQVFEVGVGMHIYKWQRLVVAVSCYGNNCEMLDSKLRDGIRIDQNREQINLMGMALKSIGQPMAMPEVVNKRWLKRIDSKYIFERRLHKVYPVLSILSSANTIHASNGTVTTTN